MKLGLALFRLLLCAAAASSVPHAALASMDPVPASPRHAQTPATSPEAFSDEVSTRAAHAGPEREKPAAVAPARPARATSPFGPDLALVAVDPSRLDRVRGGFETPAGLQIAFGIERSVYLNGHLVTTTSLNVSAGGRVSSGTGASPSLPLPGTASLGAIQVGAGNSVVSGSALGNAAGLGAVVQNTLNGQAIQSRTVINASTNSLQVLRSSGLQSSLRGVLIDSLRR